MCEHFGKGTPEPIEIVNEKGRVLLTTTYRVLSWRLREGALLRLHGLDSDVTHKFLVTKVDRNHPIDLSIDKIHVRRVP